MTELLSLSRRAFGLPGVGFGFETEHARVCFQHLRVSGSSSAQAVTAQLLAALPGSQIACEGSLRIPDLKEMWKILALIKKLTFYRLDKPPHQWDPEGKNTWF